MSTYMSRAEREEFLAGVHVGVVSVSIEETKSLPLPVWYSYEPGGDVGMITGRDSVKGRAIKSTGWFSLCAQEEKVPYKYVVVEGPVTSVEDCDPETLRSMARRYLGEKAGDAYFESMVADEYSGRLYKMTPQRWYTADYSDDLEA